MLEGGTHFLINAVKVGTTCVDVEFTNHVITIFDFMWRADGDLKRGATSSFMAI